jgi:hypothetical protein
MDKHASTLDVGALSAVIELELDCGWYPPRLPHEPASVGREWRVDGVALPWGRVDKVCVAPERDARRPAARYAAHNAQPARAAACAVECETYPLSSRSQGCHA